MKEVDAYERDVHQIRHLLIPVRDGTKLAARMWMPVDADERPVPAILEYIPYRKNDGTAVRDSIMHPYFAGHGFAAVRVDLRGSGDSDGVLTDEYLQQELDDGYDVIAWLAAQSWCTGKVGVIGKSWGGFNGLQLAAMQPPALAAVVTCCFTDDRYADDIHYMGGALLGDQLSWASIMFQHNSMPPDPENRPDDWRSLWMQRLKGSGLWLKNWLEHPHRDAFWEHGSVCEDYARIKCPVYAASGWADGYCRAVLRLVQNLSVPTRALIGPWAHKYPHRGVPEPAIGFLQDCVRWWDTWLKDRDTGIMVEPPIYLYLQDMARPASFHVERSGGWLREKTWPAPNIVDTRYYLTDTGHLNLAQVADVAAPLIVKSPATVGMHGGKWCSYAMRGDQPSDQRADDAGSLVFDTAPLADTLNLVGAGTVELTLSSDREIANVIARLCAVAPDGAVFRISYGVLNLTHRNSHTHPLALVPGKKYAVKVQLKDVAQSVPIGYRLRLALSTQYFPIVWPAPGNPTLTVYPAESCLDVPTLQARRADIPAKAPFLPAEGAPPLPVKVKHAPDNGWLFQEDLSNGGALVRVQDGGGTYVLSDNGLEVSVNGVETYRVVCADGSADPQPSAEIIWDSSLARTGWRIRTRTATQFKATPDTFLIQAKLEAWEGDELVYEQAWNERVARNLI